MSDNNRDERGRLLPGHSLPSPGRPPKAREQQMLDAITSAVGPDELKELIREAISIARSTQSARGLLAIAEFVADRSLGKPVARSITASTKFEEMLALLGSNDKPADTDEPMTITKGTVNER